MKLWPYQVKTGGPPRWEKNSQAYRAHSYHTKVPPEAIEKLIRHHTNEGSHVGLCDPHPAA